MSGTVRKSQRERVIELMLQFCVEEGLTETLRVLRQETSPDSEEGGYESNSNDEFNALYQAVEFYDALAESKKTESGRAYQKAVSNELLFSDELKSPLPTTEHTRHGYIHKANLLCVAAHPSLPHIVATSAADKSIRITDIDTQKVICVIHGEEYLPSVVLSLDFHPTRGDLLLAGCINGAVQLFSLPALASSSSSSSSSSSTSSSSSSSSESEAKGDAEFSMPHSWKAHSKYSIGVKWSEDGYGFVTAGHDGNVCLYKPVETDSSSSSSSAAATTTGVAGPMYKLVKKLTFKGQVEALERLYTSSIESITQKKQVSSALCDVRKRAFAVAVRDDNYIHIIDLDSESETDKMNMNLNNDDHVSFTALSLACSRRRLFLLVANDHNRVILYDLLHKRLLKNYYGTQNDALSTPRVSWGPHGHGHMTHVYCSSQDLNTVQVWEAESQKQVASLVKAHAKRLRDFVISPTRNVIMTVSFDQTLAVWAPPK